jgi:hypothetical protein
MDDQDFELPGNSVQIDTLRLIGAVVGLLLLAGAIYIFFESRRAGGMAIIWGMIALVGTGYALIGLGKAPCPECGFMVSGLFPRNNSSKQCPGCGEYFHTKDGEVMRTDKDAIEKYPAFATACPKEIQWPEGCCVCRAPVTQHVTVELELEENAPMAQDMLARAATLGTFKLVNKRKFAVEVPVCDEHDLDPAELEFRYDEAQLYIKFRSRAYAEAFDDLNGPVFWDS